MKEVIIILNSSKGTKIDTSDFLKEFDKFVRGNKEKDVLISFYTFNSDVQSFIDHVPISEVKEFKEINSLGECDFYNSIGIILERVSDRINSLKGINIPERVIVSVISEKYPDIHTDYSKEEINTFITYQREDYFWDFLFFGIGVNYDMKSIGFLEDEIHNIDCTLEGMGKMFSLIASRV